MTGPRLVDATGAPLSVAPEEPAGVFCMAMACSACQAPMHALPLFTLSGTDLLAFKHGRIPPSFRCRCFGGRPPRPDAIGFTVIKVEHEAEAPAEPPERELPGGEA